MRVHGDALVGSLIVATLITSIGLLPLRATSLASDPNAIARELRRELPHRLLERPIAPPVGLDSPPIFHVLPRTSEKGMPSTLRPHDFSSGRPPNRGVDIYRQRVRGVVAIATKTSIGTGSLISPTGTIITAEHVVQHAHRSAGDEWVLIWFKPTREGPYEDEQFLPARVLQRDPLRDLALVRLAVPVPQDTAAIPLSSQAPQVGEEVFSIGHPGSYFWSFTQGIVSQILLNHRWLHPSDTSRLATVIQMQTAASPGSSGSPVLDQQGAMIGVTVGGALDAQGLYFAVIAQHVWDMLRSKR